MAAAAYNREIPIHGLASMSCLQCSGYGYRPAGKRERNPFGYGTYEWALCDCVKKRVFGVVMRKYRDCGINPRAPILERVPTRLGFGFTYSRPPSEFRADVLLAVARMSDEERWLFERRYLHAATRHGSRGGGAVFAEWDVVMPVLNRWREARGLEALYKSTFFRECSELEKRLGGYWMELGLYPIWEYFSNRSYRLQGAIERALAPGYQQAAAGAVLA